MKYSYNVFSLYYGDFLYPVQAMILQLILTKGKMIKKILFPIKELYSPTLKRMIQPPISFVMAIQAVVR